MRGLSLEQITALGRRADPVILTALSRGTAPEFLPGLKYHFQIGGKRIRAAMVILSCLAAGGSITRSIGPAAAVEMIHNYSLVIDDIIDDGDVRRGMPTVRRKLGESTSILVAMSYREALDDVIRECDHSEVIRRLSVQAMKEIIDGERLDLQFEQAGRDEPFLEEHRISRPTFPSYLKMIGKKTASLFRAASMIGAHSANASSKVATQLGEFGWKAGLAFQVMDDVLDIFGIETGKQKAKDVIEHKLGNAAILIAMKYLPTRQSHELMKILNSPRVSREMAAKSIELISKTPAELECKQVAENYLREAKGHLLVVPDSKYVASLADLADRVVTRSF